MSLGAADIDGDGQRDIVVARGGADATEGGVLEVLFGPFSHGDVCSAGASSVHATRAITYGAKTSYAKLAVADFNRDGCNDVVVGNFRGGLELFVGHGSPPTCDLVAHHQDFGSAGVGVTDVQFADLNGDGTLDLVVARSVPLATAAYPQNIVWNVNNAFDFAHPWTSQESLVASYTAIVTDADGDGSKDVVFGIRGVDDDAKTARAWGSLHLGAKHAPPSVSGTTLGWPTSPSDLSGVPYVVDIDEWSTGPTTLLVTSSAHKCAADECYSAGKQRAYRWSNGGFAEISLLPQTAGNWLPGDTARLDADAQRDAVYPFACGTRNEAPGRLVLFRSTSKYVAQQVLTPEEVVRAAIVADVDSHAGAEIIVGAEKTDGAGNPTNIGHVSLVFACP